MKKRTIYSAAMLLFIGGIALFALFKGRSAATARIEFAGRTGVQLTGSYTAEGKQFAIDETLPAEIKITARRLSLDLETSCPAETVFAKVFINDKLSVAGGSTRLKIDVAGPLLFLPPACHLTAFSAD